jgi:hypothetical protein
MRRPVRRQRLTAFRALMRRKVIGLRLALAAFALGSVAFAALFLVVLWG